MKHIPPLAIAALLVIWVACKNQPNSETGIAKNTSSVENAGMILPNVPDTLLPSGRKNVYLVGRRNMEGFFVERATFPVGYRGLPHIHNNDQYITVITGSAHLAFGEKFDTTITAKPYGPGSFLIIPAGKPHYEWFTEESSVQVEGVGVMTTTYVGDSTANK